MRTDPGRWSWHAVDVNDPTARTLRLLSLLQTYKFWPGADLAQELDVSSRTLRRDIDRLRELGYPVEATPGVAGGYRLASGAHMPPLLLDDDEAVAIAIGLRAAAGASVDGIEDTSLRALAKLEQVLPPRLRRQVTTLQDVTQSVTRRRPGPTIDPSTLTELARLVREHFTLRFDYSDRKNEATQRRAEPYRIVNAGARWYVVAWDLDRADWRTFRLDRLDAPRPTGVRGPARDLPGGDAALVARSIERTVARHRAVVTLHAPEAVVLDRLGPWPQAEVEPLPGGACRLRTHADSLETLAVLVAQLDVDFTVVEPPELAAHVRRIAGRWARAAAGSPPAVAEPGA
jgi:predicted DNA-binding transcriptional regulator YafY